MKQTPIVAFLTEASVPLFLLRERNVTISHISSAQAEIYLKKGRCPSEWGYNSIGGASAIFDYFLGATRQFKLDRIHFQLESNEEILLVFLSQENNVLQYSILRNNT